MGAGRALACLGLVLVLHYQFCSGPSASSQLPPGFGGRGTCALTLTGTSRKHTRVGGNLLFLCPGRFLLAVGPSRAGARWWVGVAGLFSALGAVGRTAFPVTALRAGWGSSNWQLRAAVGTEAALTRASWAGNGTVRVSLAPPQHWHRGQRPPTCSPKTKGLGVVSTSAGTYLQREAWKGPVPPKVPGIGSQTPWHRFPTTTTPFTASPVSALEGPRAGEAASSFTPPG